MRTLGGGSHEEIWEESGPETGDPREGHTAWEEPGPRQVGVSEGGGAAGNTVKTLNADAVRAVSCSLIQAVKHTH